MPKLILAVSQHVDENIKAKIAMSLTELTMKHLNKKKEVTMINIQDNMDDWYIAAERNNKEIISYDLTIQVTAGSNTVAEKEAWLAATSNMLNEELGLTHPLPNYISILDVDGESWGFNGISQHTRLNKGDKS